MGATTSTLTSCNEHPVDDLWMLQACVSAWPLRWLWGGGGGDVEPWNDRQLASINWVAALDSNFRFKLSIYLEFGSEFEFEHICLGTTG